MKSIASILIDKWEGNDPAAHQTQIANAQREDIRAKLQHGSWIVEFTKTDGTPAVMECTLDEKILPATEAEKVGNGNRVEQDHLLHVYSLDRQGWRSFVVANVKAFYKKPEDRL